MKFRPRPLFWEITLIRFFNYKTTWYPKSVLTLWTKANSPDPIGNRNAIARSSGPLPGHCTNHTVPAAMWAICGLMNKHPNVCMQSSPSTLYQSLPLKSKTLTLLLVFMQKAAADISMYIPPTHDLWPKIPVIRWASEDRYAYLMNEKERLKWR